MFSKAKKGGKKAFFTARGLIGPKKDASDTESDEPNLDRSKTKKQLMRSLSSSYDSTDSDDGSTPSDEDTHSQEHTIFMESTDEDELEDHLNVGCIDSLFFPGRNNDKESLFPFNRINRSETDGKMSIFERMNATVERMNTSDTEGKSIAKLPMALEVMEKFKKPEPKNLELALAQFNCKGPAPLEQRCQFNVQEISDALDEDVFDMDPETHFPESSMMPHLFKSLMSLSGSSDGEEECDRSSNRLEFLARPPALMLQKGARNIQDHELNHMEQNMSDFPAIESLPSQILVQEQTSYGGDSTLSFEMIALGELSIHSSVTDSDFGKGNGNMQQHRSANYGSPLLSVDSEDTKASTNCFSASYPEDLDEKENDGKLANHVASPSIASPRKELIASPRKEFRDNLAPSSTLDGEMTEQKINEVTQATQSNTPMLSPFAGKTQTPTSFKDESFEHNITTSGKNSKAFRDNLTPLVVTDEELPKQEYKNTFGEKSPFGISSPSMFSSRIKTPTRSHISEPFTRHVATPTKTPTNPVPAPRTFESPQQMTPEFNISVPNPWIESAPNTFDLDDQMYPSFDEGPSREEKKPTSLLSPKVDTGNIARNHRMDSPDYNQARQIISSPVALSTWRNQNAGSSRFLASRTTVTPRSVEVTNRCARTADTPSSFVHSRRQAMGSPRSLALHTSVSPRFTSSLAQMSPFVKSPSSSVVQSPGVRAGRNNSIESLGGYDDPSCTPTFATKGVKTSSVQSFEFSSHSKSSIGKSMIEQGSLAASDADEPQRIKKRFVHSQTDDNMSHPRNKKNGDGGGDELMGMADRVNRPPNVDSYQNGGEQRDKQLQPTDSSRDELMSANQVSSSNKRSGLGEFDDSPKGRKTLMDLLAELSSSKGSDVRDESNYNGPSKTMNNRRNDIIHEVVTASNLISALVKSSESACKEKNDLNHMLNPCPSGEVSVGNTSSDKSISRPSFDEQTVSTEYFDQQTIATEFFEATMM